MEPFASAKVRLVELVQTLSSKPLEVMMEVVTEGVILVALHDLPVHDLYSPVKATGPVGTSVAEVALL